MNHGYIFGKKKDIETLSRVVFRMHFKLIEIILMLL